MLRKTAVPGLVRRTRPLIGLTLAAALVLLTACSSTTSGAPASSKGGTITFAWPPGSPPTDIFPLLSTSQYTNVNLNEFTNLLYRPLYWVGQGSQVVLNEGRSLADPPVWSSNGRVVTVHLKHFTWSDGTAVSARDVLFWQNLVTANKTQDGGYVPGDYPDNVIATKVVNPTTVQFTLNKAWNHSWFLLNELAQVVPLPLAWDKTCATCSTGTADETPAGAKAVYNYLEGQAKDLNTYATNPLWKIVDGEWALKQFNPDGYSVFIPNSHYSGPKPHIGKFVAEPFTSATAEFDAIKSGSGPDVGYLPVTDLPAKAAVLAQGYNLAPWADWNYNFIGLNFHNPAAGKIFSQLYIRQALQSVMDQQTMVKYAYGGYAWPIYGPVPPQPANSYNTIQSNPYPYSVAAARQLLASHGWVIHNGLATCAKPGSGASQCGSGIKAGAMLQFTMLVANENPPLLTAMEDYKTDAGKAGIDITLTQAPILTVFGDMAPCSGASCSWQMGNYGVGWTYFPDYYPTGEDTFETGAGANFGGYSEPVNDANIKYTNLAPPAQSQAALDRYQKYLAQQLPVLWQPNYDYQLTLIRTGINGVTPQSPVLQIIPSQWSRN
ncbi:MAG: peptide ABC transporter substrate-binding protein [Streptosporangiaceae bacterium]